MSAIAVEDLKVDKKSSKLTFTLRNVDVSFANALRRASIEEVPTMAIEDVEIRRNSSVLYDEIVAHRLGLLPLKTDLKSYVMTKDCKCEGQGCARCQLKFTLKVKGPCIVYAEDLKSDDPKVVPVNPKTPIAKLLKGQKIELEATATLGQGKDHVKWAPGLVYYTYLPTVTVNNSSSKMSEFKDKYPALAFDKSGKIDKNAIIEHNLLDAVDGVCEDIVKVEYDNTGFVFHVESWEQLSCVDIIETAADMLNKKLDELCTLVVQEAQ